MQSNPPEPDPSDDPASESDTISPEHSGLTPWQILQTYDDKTWEQFIEEWATGFEPPYHQVVPLGGAGDKGRDIVAYLSDPTNPNAPWDSYQCKHYKAALTPTNVYVELAKLCYYTHIGDYTIPRRYRFIAPRGVGTKLHDKLRKPDTLRAELIANWDQYCRDEIQEKEVLLEGELREYIDSFDFSIVWFETPQQILNQHERTKFFLRRFRLSPPKRPPVAAPPSDVAANELGYIHKLLAAYSDHRKHPFTLESLVSDQALTKHLKHSRYCFYAADALNRFSRDNFGLGDFDNIKQHVHDGVFEITFANHTDGLQCVIAVTTAAASLKPPKSDLSAYVGPADKKGLCHHLANEGDLTWCGHA